MYLQQNPALAACLLQRTLHVNHSLLHDIRSSTLNRRIDSSTLSKAAQIEVAVTDIRQIAAATHKRAHIALLTRLRHNILHIFFYARITRKIALDIACGLLAAYVQLLSQAKVADAVHNAKVDSLRPAAHLVRYLSQRHTEDLGSGAGVDILPMTKRI